MAASYAVVCAKPLVASAAALAGRNATGLQRGDGGRVIGRVSEERDLFEVLGRGADEGDAANIDVFNGVSQGGAEPRNGLLEWVKVDGYKVNGLPAESLQLTQIFGRRAGQQSTMDGWMKGFDAAA